MMGPTVSGGRIEGVPEIERNRNGRGGGQCVNVKRLK